MAFDDTTRHAYLEMLLADQQGTAIGFLRRALAWFNGQGVECRQVMSDNGSAYISKAFSLTLASGIAATATDEDYRDEAGPEIPSNRDWDDMDNFPETRDCVQCRSLSGLIHYILQRLTLGPEPTQEP